MQSTPALPRHLADALSAQGPVVSAIRAALPQAFGVYAFGSQLAGSAQASSDLDLAVLLAGYADPVALWELAGLFECVILSKKTALGEARSGLLADIPRSTSSATTWVSFWHLPGQC